MLYISAIYDDDTYDVTDYLSNRTEHLSKTELKNILKNRDIIGATLSTDNRLYCTFAFSTYSLSDQVEADAEKHEWDNEHFDNRMDSFVKHIGNDWVFFEPDYDVIEVYYGVYRLELGQYHMYLSKYPNDPPTPYKDAAKRFKKKDAYAVAQKLTKSKKNPHSWSVERI